MRYSTIIALLLCSAALCYADDATTCSVSATITYIEGSSTVNIANRTVANYTVTLTNNGSCTIQQVLLGFRLTAGGNYEGGLNATAVIGGSISILGFGASLVPGVSISRSIISVSYPVASFPRDIPVRSADVQCLVGCQAPGGISATCSARVNTQYRQDSVALDSDGNYIADYDVFVDNAGACPITAITVSFTIPSGAAIMSSTNTQSSLGGYLITGYGASLAPGATAFATIRVIAMGFAQSLDTVIYGVACDGCSISTTAPSTPAPATSAPISTSCASTSSLSLRQGEGATWTDGTNTQFGIFDVTVTNTGKCTLGSVKITFTLATDTAITQFWNLQKNADGTYDVENFYSVEAGRSFTGAGLIVSFANGKQVTNSASVSTISQTCTTACSA